MGKRALWRFTYDRNQNLITKSDFALAKGVSPRDFLATDEAKRLLSDVKGIDGSRFETTIDSMRSDTLVRAYASGSKDVFYTLTIKRNRKSVYKISIVETPLAETSANSRRVRVVASFMVAIIVGCGIVATLFVRKDIYSKKNADANDTVAMVSEQIERTVTAEFNAWFKEIEMISTLMKDYTVLNGQEAEIDAVLRSVEGTISFRECGVLVETGDLFFSQERTYNIAYENFAESLIIGRKAAVDVIDINSKEYIVFGLPFGGASRKSTGKISAICGIAEPSSVNDLLSINAFDKTATVSIIKSDGFRIAVGESNVVENDVTYPNMFKIVKGRTTEEQYENFEKQFLAGESGTMKMSGSDGEYYVYYSPLSISNSGDTVTDNWRLVIFVPESSILSYVNQLSMVLIGVMAGVLLVSAGLAALLILSYLRKRNTDMLLNRRVMEAELLEVKAAKASEASEAKTSFFSNMSHDMRTPLNGIIGMSAIAQKHLDNPEVLADCFKKIDGASEHLLSLINNVLDMSRIESKKVEIVPEKTNVLTLADECKSIVYAQLQDRKINFVTDRSAVDRPFVMADGLHLKQVLINVLGNAIKFTPDGGSIYFTIKERPLSNNTVSIDFIIQDTGAGMSPEFVKKAFEPFTQEHSDSVGKVKGSGLGLSIAWQLAKLMGGTINIESEEGKGTRMTVTIPFEYVEETSDEVSVKKNAGFDAEAVKGLRVLLVEDDELNREIAIELLKDSGLIVECAENGKEACDKFFAHTEKYYDAILMDFIMPVMDGITATETIRASDNPNAKSVCIIAMTANAFEEDVRRSRQAGFNEHLSKPIRINEVLKTIARLAKK